MLRNSLVVLQVALSIVLVTGATLFARSFQNAQSVELGFEPENRLIIGVRLQNHGYDVERGTDFIRLALERLQGLPGARHVSAMNMQPFRGRWTGSFMAEGVQPPEGDRGFDSGFNRVGPGYFAAMEIPLIVGREFSIRDDRRQPQVVVVNEAVADMLWPGEDAIGRSITRGREPWTVVGVARNATYYQLGEDPQPQIYMPYLQNYGPTVNFVIHTAGEPTAFVRSIEDELHVIDASIAFTRVSTIEEGLEGEIGQYRVSATLVSIFGFLALFLATVGLYGVLSYLVVRSTRDIGIQVALGATRAQVGSTVIVRGLKLAVTGIVVGTGAALATSRLVSSLLYGIEARDPVTFVVVPLVLLAVTCLASFLPARRASRVDPMRALRYE